MCLSGTPQPRLHPETQVLSATGQGLVTGGPHPGRRWGPLMRTTREQAIRGQLFSVYEGPEVTGPYSYIHFRIKTKTTSSYLLKPVVVCRPGVSTAEPSTTYTSLGRWLPVGTEIARCL